MNTGETEIETMRSGTRVFTGHLFRVRNGRKTTFSDKPPPRHEPVRRPARIARVLALAHCLQAEVDGGKYLDRADLARQLAPVSPGDVPDHQHLQACQQQRRAGDGAGDERYRGGDERVERD